jgi:hypothetical protein
MKEMIRRIPIVRLVAKEIRNVLSKFKIFQNYGQGKSELFPGSEKYWMQRYDSGENSGLGSYGKLAEFKADIINDFVKNNDILTIIEYGCGDGNQLKLANYPSYIGFDVSPKALALCRNIFQSDNTKSFKLMTEYGGETAQLTLSLDVIYHLVEDDIFYSYMKRLFNSSERYVIIYSTNYYKEYKKSFVKHRQFSRWIETNKPNWKLVQYLPNKHPNNADGKEGSNACFYIYENF